MKRNGVDSGELGCGVRPVDVREAWVLGGKEKVRPVETQEDAAEEACVARAFKGLRRTEAMTPVFPGGWPSLRGCGDLI